ncbi:putative prolyl 4-hydroxylase 10-like protein 3 [Colletotrichum chlorophyti]|uniref:Putative prolyl 4-hydroxylase 10-like protein 3 n=1 Tax=Colletotrichum chlorophyti TaxID=708187 RepID=A0A1Q8S369_9PEZI|nr:putative prolyl 4-hydroxylase 10-like protein 3 [Colletotrichum chlorophyti]
MGFFRIPPPRSAPASPPRWSPLLRGLPVYAGLAPLALILWSFLPARLLSNELQPIKYSIRILCYDPLIIYIVGFLSLEERKVLASIGQFQRSMTTIDGVVSTINPFRTSSTAFLPPNNTVVERITARASEFQGYSSRSKHEMLQLTRYETGQVFKPHVDPLVDDPRGPRNRFTTIFAIVEATCTECGTQFPNLRFDWAQEHPSWCEYVYCDKETLTIKAIPGNAVLWKSWDSSGRLDLGTLHAGLPPEKGTKIGLNIWTDA